MKVHWTTDCHNGMCAIKLLIKRRRKKKTFYLRFCVVAAATRKCREYIVLTQTREHKRRSSSYQMDASALILSIRLFATSTEDRRTECWENEENFTVRWRRAKNASLCLTFSGTVCCRNKSRCLYNGQKTGKQHIIEMRCTTAPAEVRWNSPYGGPRF